MTKITQKDLKVLSLMTDYLFCDNFRDVLDFARETLKEDFPANKLETRQIQSKLKGALWSDFMSLRRKLKELAR